MSLPDDLLEQARHLLTVKGRLEQVNLRRAVSASYYALFHLLTSSASSLFTSEARLLARINRSFDHKKMKEVSLAVSAIKNDEWFKRIELLAPAFSLGPDLDKLRTVAAAFYSLQGKRHEADYNLDLVYSQTEAKEAIDLAQGAFDRWREIERTDLSRLYLASFLLRNEWSKDPR